MLKQRYYNLLFCWFVGLSPDDPIWHPTTFIKNREAKAMAAASPGADQKTLGADKNYDTKGMVEDLRLIRCGTARGAEHRSTRRFRH